MNVFSHVQLRGSSTSQFCETLSALTYLCLSSTLLETVGAGDKASAPTFYGKDACATRRSSTQALQQDHTEIWPPGKTTLAIKLFSPRS